MLGGGIVAVRPHIPDANQIIGGQGSMIGKR
jgi:hypothetical protein